MSTTIRATYCTRAAGATTMIMYTWKQQCASDVKQAKKTTKKMLEIGVRKWFSCCGEDEDMRI